MLLKNIRLNEKTKLYEVVEAATKYEFDHSLLIDLSSYLKENPGLLIAHWYRSLDNSNKEKVKKSSAFEQTNPNHQPANKNGTNKLPF